MAAEFEFIDWIRAQSEKSDRVLVPPGDDLAVLKWSGDDLLLVGNDQVLDGVHFDSKTHSPRDIGRKVMNRNLSDCAAMACLPAAAVTTAALPRGTSMDYAKELYLGMRDAAAIYDCPIVGGDTASWDGKLVMTVTILGRSGGIIPVTRNGARVGDRIYVTGALGGSLLGRHMNFTPRIAEARYFAQIGISAMIDLSDGLSRDLRHICSQSNVGALIEAVSIPVHEDAIEMRRDGHSPLEHALHDGEDYELLFTSELADLPGLMCIGAIAEPPGIWLVHPDDRREPLEPKGWEHTF